MRPRDDTPAFLSNDTGRLIEPVCRGFSILEAFIGAVQWLGNEELAAITGIPKATVPRLTRALAALGYLEYRPGLRKYGLAPAVLALGYSAVGSCEAAGFARAQLQQLADSTQTFVSLVSRDLLDLVMQVNCHGATTALTLGLSAKSRLPISSCPIGWALLAGLPERERTYLMSHLRDREQRHWPFLLSRLTRSTREVEQHGFCISIGEWASDIAVVAAPLQIAHGPAMALACAGPKASLTRAHLSETVGPRLKAVADILQLGSAACPEAH